MPDTVCAPRPFFMRRFLFLVLGLGMVLPTAANAESYWLVIIYRESGLEKIEMPSMAECEIQAAVYMSSKRFSSDSFYRGFECLKGK